MTKLQSDVIADLRERIQEVESGNRTTSFWSSVGDEHLANKRSSHLSYSVSDKQAPSMVSDEPSTEASSLNNGATQTDSDECFAKICRLLNARERCSKELIERLVKDGFDESVSHEAVERAIRCGLVDDVRFAETLVRSRLSQGKGVAGIGRELRTLGFDLCAVESYAALTSGNLHDREVSRALDLLERKPPRSKNPRASAYRRLATKGFSASVAADASRMWWDGQCSRSME